MVKSKPQPLVTSRILSYLLVTLIFANPFSLASTVQTYDQLVSEIRLVRSQSEQRIEAAVEAEKVREAWEIGKKIDDHILLNKERAEYGKEVLIKLSNDLGLSQPELSYMLQFARAYPNYPHADNLSWSDFRELLSLNDPKERQEVTEKASVERWNREQIRKEIRKRKNKSQLLTPNPSSLAEIKPGRPNVYRIIKAPAGPYKDQLVLDLGFSNYLRPSGFKNLREGDILQLSADGRRLSAFADSGGLKAESSLYTYEAYVTDVVDGDTFHAVIDLGFGFTTVQRVRLLRIDAPELVSADGKKAKKALEKVLMKNGGKILIQSKELDQHGRPIGNVFVCSARSDKASADGTRTTGDECDGKSIDPQLLKSFFFTIRDERIG